MYQQTEEQKQKITDIKTNKPDKFKRLMSFLEAEGSLFAILRVQRGRKFGYRLTLSANIANMDKQTIEEFKDLVGCGTIRKQPRQQTIWYWEISSQEEIHNVFIPLMQQLPFQTHKLLHDFPLFVQCNEILTSTGSKDINVLLKVLSLRNRFISRRTRGANDKASFEKIISILESECTGSKANDPVLLDNIAKLKEAIQILNTKNTTLWL